MASASLPMPSINSTAVQPRPRTLFIVSRVPHPTTRNLKVSVPQSGRDSLGHPSHGVYRDAAGSSSSGCHQGAILGVTLKQFSAALFERLDNSRFVPSCKTLPFSVFAQVGHVYGELTKNQQLLRDQIWFGYWIGPEDVDGWGFVEAYLLPI